MRTHSLTKAVSLAACALALMGFGAARGETCAGRASGVLFEGKIPATFRLLKPCRNAMESDADQTFWFFVGAARISGTIEYVREPGDEFPKLLIMPDHKSRGLLPDGLVEWFELADFERIRALHLPKLTRKKLCFSQQATVEIRKIDVIDDDSDESGTVISDYSFAVAGIWKACKVRRS